MSSTDYAALVDTIKIEDITSNKINQSILQQLMDNDGSFNRLYIVGGSSDDQDHDDYIPDDGEDTGWLGYFIGQNTKLQHLHFFERSNTYTESFFREISCNASIEMVQFNGISLVNGNLISMLGPIFQNNNSLNEIRIGDCYIFDSIRQLSLAIGNCNKSLKTFELGDNGISYGQLVDIITALSMHPQLEVLTFMGMRIGRNEYTALATLLRCTTTQLQKLDLRRSDIDDEGIEALVDSLAGVNRLRQLHLSNNRSITVRGWKAVATLLATPGSNLEKLNFSNNTIEDEGARIFASALVNNTTLKALYLDGNHLITATGRAPFKKLLCDTSSVNNTYLSNHTLEQTGTTISPWVDWNRMNNADKQQVAMKKIIHVHSYFDMQPFFEWEFKVLPLMIDWFKKADACTDYLFERKNHRMKLSAVYDFIKEFPMLYIEPVTRKEIAKYADMEEQLQGDKLVEIQQLKARALRRL